MMKRLFYLLIAFSLLFVGCFDDDSNTHIKDLNPIVIELTGGNQLSVKQLDTLRIEPLVYCKGVDDSDLSFEWMLMSYGTIVPRLLDTTMYCCAQITEVPGKNYTVRLTVTDKTTGIFQIQTYVVNVLGNIETGLLIADTRDGGTTSDVNLVKSREFNGYYSMQNENRDIYRHIWEGVNGTSFAGRLLALNTSDAWSQNTCVTAVTTEGLYRANYKDYKEVWTGSEMFYVKPPFDGQAITSAEFTFLNNNKWETLMINGLMYDRNLQNNGRQYGTPIYPSRVKDYKVTLRAQSGGRTGINLPAVYAYDELGQRMLFFGSAAGYQAVNQMSGPFNVNDLSGFNPLYLGECADGMTLLAINKSNGNLEALVMKTVVYGEVSKTTDFAQARYDLSAAPHVGLARAYALSPQGNAFYYATENEVYAGSMNTAGTARVRWTAAPGETITGIQFYTGQAGKHYYMGPSGSEAQQDSKNNLLLITTSTASGEGKVTCVPVVHANIGQLEEDEKYQIKLEGFGEILGIYNQL